MRRAGEVVRVAQGLLVLRAGDETYPDIGATVVDDQLAAVGRVVDVFGPVARPYVAVSPEGPADPGFVGQPVYVREET